MRPLVALLVLAFSIGLIAQPRLSDERPLDPAAGQMPSSASIYAVSTHGRGDGLVLWGDSRSWVAGFAPLPLYSGRIDAAGNLLNPSGRFVTRLAFTAALASNGTNYLAAFTNEQGLWTVRFNDDGVPLEVAKQLRPFDFNVAQTRLSLAWNGEVFMLVRWIYLSLGGDAEATILDRDGNVLRTFSLPVKEVAALYTSGGQFKIVGSIWNCSTCADQMELRTINASASGVTDTRVLLTRPYQTNVTALSSGDRLLVATLSNSPAGGPGHIEVTATVFDPAGNRLNEQMLQSDVSPFGVNRVYTISSAWDGERFLVCWLRQTDASTQQTVARRLSIDGAPLDSASFVLSESMVQTFQLNDVALVVDRSSAIRATDFMNLPADRTALVQAKARQDNVRLTNTVAGPLAVWTETSADVRLKARSLFSDPVEITHLPLSTRPVIAVAQSTALIVFVQQFAGSYHVVAQRVALSGTPIDAAPRIIFEGPAVNQVAVASDGQDFLVVWASSRRLQAAVVTSGGSVSVANDIFSDQTTGPESPQVAWTGSHYVVTWHLEVRLIQPILGASPSAPLYATRVDRNGRNLDSAPRLVNSGDNAFFTSGDFLTNGPGYLVQAWVAQSSPSGCRCLFLTAFTADLAPITGKNPMAVSYDTAAARANDPSIAWDGSAFVIVWGVSNEWNYFVEPTFAVMARRIDGAFKPIDAAPFLVSPPGTVALAPSVAADLKGAVIGYSRLATDGVSRVFVRTLDRIATAKSASASRISR